MEAIDEGNGTGWRLIGKDIEYYGDIGLNAVDLSESWFPGDFGALGQNSFAAGLGASAMGINSIALAGTVLEEGQNGFASVGGKVFSQGGIALGGCEVNTGSEFSIAMGTQSRVYNSPASIAIGRNNDVGHALYSAEASFAIGEHNQIVFNNNENRGALGWFNQPRGTNSLALGTDLEPRADLQVSIGSYETYYVPDGTNDKAFNVGIGSSSMDKKDGLTILKTGLVTFPELTNQMISDGPGTTPVTKAFFDANNEAVLPDGDYADGSLSIWNGHWSFSLNGQDIQSGELDYSHLDEGLVEDIYSGRIATQAEAFKYIYQIKTLTGDVNMANAHTFYYVDPEEEGYGQPNRRVLNVIGDQITQLTIQDWGGGLVSQNYEIINDGDFRVDVLAGTGATFKGDPDLQGVHSDLYLDTFGRISITEIEDGVFFIECPKCNWYTP